MRVVPVVTFGFESDHSVVFRNDDGVCVVVDEGIDLGLLALGVPVPVVDVVQIGNFVDYPVREVVGFPSFS
jgi:hypothetical protein